MVTTRKPGLQRALRQRGQALLLALLVAGVAGGALLFSYYRPATLTLESEQKTTDALALVKTALIGWTVKRGDNTLIPFTPCTVNPGGWTTCTGTSRPGEFPCPDTDNDGIENSTSCPPGQLGRVPWKTLGIPEPKDSAGETLWYAVAGPFRARKDSLGNNLNNTGIINSDTHGNITVYDADGTTLLADGSSYQTPKGAVAVILAPGRVLGSQVRDAAIAYCATTDTNIARNQCAANYLETGPNNRNNAKIDGPFINGTLSPTFNDRLVYLTTPEFMPAVERRVASEVKAWLDGYRAVTETAGSPPCKCYPWAASFTSSNTESVTGVNRGRFPYNNARPVNWGNNGTPQLSSWFTYNKWYSLIYYAIAKQNTENQGLLPTLCTTCTFGTTTLSVDGKPVISAIFFTPGTPLYTPGPPVAAITRPSNTLADYLEDTENKNGDDSYVTPIAPPAPAPDRDRIYTSISAPAAPPPENPSDQCQQMGRALRKITPCGQPPKLNPACAALAGTDLNGNVLTPAQGLQVCSSACATAAWRLVNPPCQNTTKPSVCRNARETLREDC